MDLDLPVFSSDDEEYLPPVKHSRADHNRQEQSNASYDSTSYTSYSSDEYEYSLNHNSTTNSNSNHNPNKNAQNTRDLQQNCVPTQSSSSSFTNSGMGTKRWNTRAQVNMSDKSLEELEADHRLLDLLDAQTASYGFDTFDAEHVTLQDLEEYLHAYNEEEDADYLPDREIRDVRTEIRIPQRELDLLLEDLKKGGGEESFEHILSDSPEFTNAPDVSKLCPVNASQAKRLKRLLDKHIRLLHGVSTNYGEAEGLLKCLADMSSAAAAELRQKEEEYPQAVKVYEEQKKILAARGFRKTRHAERELQAMAGKSLIVLGLDVMKPTKSLLLSPEFAVLRKVYVGNKKNMNELVKAYAEPDASVQERLVCSNGREKFTVDEEKLLLLGLERFTLKDLESVHKHLLPDMAASQLKHRYKNRSSPLLNFNIIQEYKLRQIKRPLSASEIERLKEGVAFCGANQVSFDLISDKFLPHLGPDCLRACFRVYKLGRKKKRSAAEKDVERGKEAKRSRVEGSSGEGGGDDNDGEKALSKKWQKPHDREILLAVKRSGACDQTFRDLSKAFLFSEVFSEEEIRNRYAFLLEMLEKRRAGAQQRV